MVTNDTQAYRLTLRSPASQAEAVYHWDKETALFRGDSKKPCADMTLDSSGLQRGMHVLVLYQLQGKVMLAKRIVCDRAVLLEAGK